MYFVFKLLVTITSHQFIVLWAAALLWPERNMADSFIVSFLFVKHMYVLNSCHFNLSYLIDIQFELTHMQTKISKDQIWLAFTITPWIYSIGGGKVVYLFFNPVTIQCFYLERHIFPNRNTQHNSWFILQTWPQLFIPEFKSLYWFNVYKLTSKKSSNSLWSLMFFPDDSYEISYWYQNSLNIIDGNAHIWKHRPKQ